MKNIAVRDTSLDNVCAIMIIYMIYGHVCLWCGVKQNEILTRCLYFFMPWFFFKSGMFFREEPVRQTLLKGIKRLVVPYIIFSIIGQFVFWIMWILQGRDVNIDYILSPLRTLLHEGAVVGNSPLWFLFTLFLVRLIFIIIYKRTKKIVMVITFLSVVVPFVLCLNKFHDFYYISNVCSGLFFYIMGFYLKDKQYEMKYMVLGLLFYLLYAIYYHSYFDFRSNQINPSFYILCFLSCIGGIIVYNNIFKRLFSNFKILEYIGRNSMSYYVLHWIVLGVMSILFKYILNFEDGYLLFSIYLISNILLLPLLDVYISKKFKWVIGK